MKDAAYKGQEHEIYNELVFYGVNPHYRALFNEYVPRHDVLTLYYSLYPKKVGYEL